MRQYLDFLQHILDVGEAKDDRTNTGTISTFGYQMRFDLRAGFPLLTTKKVFLKAVIYELLWFISGDTNIKYLVDRDVRIWNEWPYQKYAKSSEFQGDTQDEFVSRIKNDPEFARKWGDLGPVYGHQWRNFASEDGSVDQLGEVIEQIKTNPNSRRLIISSWQAADVSKMALPPCHLLFQFYVNNGKLSCGLYQRSGDAFLGVPFNIASYALLTLMIAKVCDLEPGEFVHTIGDAHIYSDHLAQVKLQLSRIPRELPRMIIKRDVKSIDDFRFEDFELQNYNPYPAIKAKVAV